MRIACVYVPDLPLQAVLRRTPEHQSELQSEPVALAETTGERARVLACTHNARQAGVRPGLLVSQARAVASGILGPNRLRVLVASAADSEATTAALADLGYGFAPRVEREGERLFLEVSELGQLYPAGERAVAQAIAAQATRLGLMVRVGIASGKAVARVAAQAAELAVVPAGEERRFLAPLAVAQAIAAGTPRAVAPDTETAQQTLTRWGTRTLGAVAALPAGDVGVRLGRFGVWLHQLANGRGEEPFAPALPADAMEEGTELDYPLYEIEPVTFVLRGLLDRALARLSCRGLACAGLTLRLKLDPRGFDVRDVPLGAPTRETATLLQLVRLDLARRPPSAPVVGMTALVLPARVRSSQLDLWRPAGPAPEALAATLARLSALVGPENVGTPALVDTFREEAVAMTRFSTDAARTARGLLDGQPTAADPPGVGEDGRLGFRRFRPPEPVEVLMDRDGPSALRGRNLMARVLIAAGPYRSGGAWWSEESFSRDYWDVQASDGAVYRLHQDRKDGTWYADGYYD